MRIRYNISVHFTYIHTYLLTYLVTRLIMEFAKWNQQPVTVTSPKTGRYAETDASSKSAMRYQMSLRNKYSTVSSW